MPCEGCNVQFTVFRRKRSCSECKRFYCSNCLSGSKRLVQVARCRRCAIFARRPLLRTDLLQLKPKDLIFYLQSKHISTSGCVEKEELVGLVLNHIQQTDDTNARNSPSDNTNADATANSFDSIKQSCQNFFTNITDNLSDSFSAFDGRTTKAQHETGSRNTQTTAASNDATTYIFDQPRVATREMPSYASCQSNAMASSAPSVISNDSSNQQTMLQCEDSALSTKSNQTSPTASPVISLSTTTSPHAPLNDEQEQSQSTTTAAQASGEIDDEDDDEAKSDCECSDDELIADFNERMTAHMPQLIPSIDTAEPVASGVKLDDESSQSSFEELGAIGGISDDSKAATDTNSSNMEQWHILDHQRLENADSSEVAKHTQDNTNNAENVQVTILEPQSQQQQDVPIAPCRVKKVSRRRSDGYLNRRRPGSEDDSPTGLHVLSAVLQEQSELADDAPNRDVRYKNCCTRCGKNKSTIRRHVEKMRRRLEHTQMSEAEIKQELREFLAYLEQRTKSIDCSDSETAVSALSGTNCTQTTGGGAMTPQFDDNEGIHVYAAFSGNNVDKLNTRFIKLEAFNTLTELEHLSVKQLKEVLMLNRVDYKGCCEKQELLERVKRLWSNLKSAPTTEKLQTDELCKICMDAPIECVILECGHMATCTNCGKVLSECPICRQYIVRVVRFFRA